MVCLAEAAPSACNPDATVSNYPQIDTLLDLHAKLSTVVRYYDRMLEERLSKAYGQHNLGEYNLPPPRQPSGPYPSISANPPNNLGPAENFYTGEQQQQQQQQQHDYNKVPSAQPYGQAPQPTPQPVYASYDKRASVAGPPNGQYLPQQAQRTGSWGPNAPPPQQPQYAQQSSYPPAEAAHSQPNHNQQPLQQASLAAPAAPESVGNTPTPTTDPNASFYFNNQPPTQTQQQQPTAGPDQMASPYPSLQQPSHSYQPSLPQTPASVAAQPCQPTQAHQSQHQSQPSQSSQPYWQHPAAQQTQLPPVWQAQPNATYSPYPQETFPSAPQHAPKQPVVEESLIEL